MTFARVEVVTPLATVNDFGAMAPSEIKADADLLVSTINTAAQDQSLDGLSDVGGVGAGIDAYCA
jgi:hypothetical protein